MSLTDSPSPPNLITPDAPFLLTARWWGGTPTDPVMFIAAAEYPGAWPREYAIGAALATPVTKVEHDELPITLALRARGSDQGSYWAFEYLGGPEFFAADQLAPPMPVVEPTPMSPDQLSEQAEAMLRESLGVPAGEPIPTPEGPLPPSEQPEPPYRFDPYPHMDLSKAEPAPEWDGEAPATAPPGPPPQPNATTSPVPELPPPAPPGPGVHPDAEPFAH